MQLDEFTVREVELQLRLLADARVAVHGAGACIGMLVALQGKDSASDRHKGGGVSRWEKGPRPKVHGTGFRVPG